MRICLVSLGFAPYRGSGLSIYAETLAQGLSEAGHEVIVICGRGRGTLSLEDERMANILRLPIGRTNWIGHAYRASRLLKEIKGRFDIAHFADVHFAYACDGPYVATLHQSFRQRLRAAGSLPYHSSLLNLVGRYLYYNLARLLAEVPSLNKAQYLVSVSQNTKDEFVARYGVEPSKIDVVWTGVDGDLFRWKNASNLRERLGLEGKRVLLYVGFSTPRKGLEHLAQALGDLGGDVRLLIVGKWEPGYRKRFVKAAGKNMDRVIEVGYVADEEMPFYYSLADIFVLPSLLEGFGLPLVEALACSTPIVATSVGAIPEIVEDCGFLVPPRDPVGLAKAIRKLLADDDLRLQLGGRGRRRVEEHFRIEEMIRRTIAVYEKFRGSAK